MSTHNNRHQVRICKDFWRKLKILILWKGCLSYKIFLLEFYYLLKPPSQQPRLYMVTHTRIYYKFAV